MTKQYDERNAMALGEYYGLHVHAMTVESLHAKSDIAAELGWRDKRIDELLAALEEKDQQLARYSMSAGQADQRLCESRAVRIALGFGEDSIDVAPTDLVEAIQVIKRRAEEAEQRLQQPIKLPKSGIGMACKFVGDHIVVSLAAVLVETAMAGFRAEVEGE